VNAPLESSAVLAAGGTVITATHRLARQMRFRYDLAQASAGRRAWPTADVLPLDAWLRRTWEANVVAGAARTRGRLLSEDESRLVWRRVIARGGGHRLDAGVIVPLVANGWRVCRDWGIAAGDLQRSADSDDGRAFADWAAAYTAEMARHAWLDMPGLLIDLAGAPGEARASGDDLVGFAGFSPWTPALAALAGALQAAGARIVRIARPRRNAGQRVVAARDERDELARAFRWAAAVCSRDAAASPETAEPVAIVLPDLEREAGRVRRTGLDILAPGWQLREPRSRPVALAIGRHLADYPIVHCALGVLAVVNGPVPFEEASLLLRSCYLAGAGEERLGRAEAELRLRQRPLEHVGLPALLADLAGGAPIATTRWRQAGGLAAGQRSGRRLPSEWAVHFAALLAAAGWPGTRPLASEEYQAAEAWQKLLESFAGTDEVAGNLSVAAALGMLGQQARDRAFEPESAAGAVQVLSLREAEGQGFAALWICGLTADRWPPPARPHPLIPLALQRAAGIPEASAATLEAHTRRRFARLLDSAGDVVLSWPGHREEAETLPSPLLRDLAGGGGPAAESSGPEEAAALHPDRQRIAGTGPPEEVPADHPPLLPPGQELQGGARVLAIQSVCPARAFIEFRLRAGALEPPARPLDLATRGRVVHRLLERLYRLPAFSRGLASQETGALRGAYAGLIGDVLDEFLPGGEPFLDRLRSLETERLWTLVGSLRELDAERPGFQVVTEEPRQVRVGPLELGIRLDRLDRLDDGGDVVFDYKTGRFSPGGWKKPRVPESQLPLYAVTAGSRGVAVIQLSAAGARISGVGDGLAGIRGIRAPAKFFRQVDLDWSGARAWWRSELELLAAEFAAGDFRVNPADRRWATGQFAGLTRIHEFPPPADDEPDAAEGEE
jgi:probable DNA repair protein